MTKRRGPDKNLQNVAKDLEQPHINAHFDNQQQQQTDDRRHRDHVSHDEEGHPSVGGLKHVET